MQITSPGIETEAFLRRATTDGYNLQNSLIVPNVTWQVSKELEDAGLLFDLIEREPTSELEDKGLRVTHMLHQTLNKAICEIEDEDKNHLPLFSVRVFEPGLHGTTIHRNDSCVGPWTVGITLDGEAPFNVYRQDQLAEDDIRPLVGDDTDPLPYDSIETTTGTGWVLYTEHTQVPHSSGIVNSPTQRELIIFYDLQALRG